MEQHDTENVGKVIRSSARSWTSSSRRALPAIYNAMRMVPTGPATTDAIDVVVEVQQHLGENRVRAVAMKPTDGMQRGMKAHRHRRADPGAGRARRRSAAC